MVRRISSPEELEKIRGEIIAKKKPKKHVISVCISTGCVALGAREVISALEEELEKRGLKDDVEVKETGCVGFCEQGPRITICPQEICYFKVKPEDVPEIVSETIIKGKVVERLLYTDPTTGEKISKLEDIPFYRCQLRLLLENNAKINPKNIEDYIAIGGYRALAKALFKMTPNQIIEEIKNQNCVDAAEQDSQLGLNGRLHGTRRENPNML